ncbi:FAD-dependent monooxygenase [Agromyces soli]
MAGRAPQLSTDVLVVGAGPSGLMLGVCLARLGVDAIVIDGKAGPTRESRALGVQARSLEIYAQLGLIDGVLAEATSAPAVVPGFRDRPFGRISLRGLGAGVTPYPELTVLEQSRNERILAEALDEAGRPVRWGWRLARLDVGEGRAPGDPAAKGQPPPIEAAGAGVRATVETPDGPASIAARYCVGADGAHSIVRETLGIAFEGITNQHTFFVSDAHGVRGLTTDAINLRFAPDDFLLAFPMGEGARMRLLGIVRDRDLAPDGTLPEELVRPRLAREFAVEYDDSAWFATYRLHHRLAARFRQGPCFLVGDAAHIHSPVGAQGMNTGLQEAHNLACAFADVLLDGRPDARLDRYEFERRPVGAILVATTDRLFAAVTSESRRARLVRGRLLPLVGPLGVRLLPRLVGGRRVFGYLSQTRIRYRLPEASGDPRSAVLGRRLPWAGTNYAALRSLSWQVHGYGVPDWVVRRAGARLGVEAHAFERDPHGRLRRDRLYLVRRDGFVVAEAVGPQRRGWLDGMREVMRCDIGAVDTPVE